MKTCSNHIKKPSLLFVFFICCKAVCFSQGRVVVNEFMAWSGCNTTNEFIELLNFGPGPMNIGCYIVTNGKYAVTIPPNTILQPGQFYLISGENTLAKKCGNIDSAVTVDLNWNTCNCADKAIPTTGDGFMENGGNANEKVVLLDPSLNVVDAVSRYTPVSSSVSITTSSLSGSCTSRTFDLGSMSISYEVIGQSTGVDNSYARKVDGDCGWVKTTDISARAPNKTNSTSSVNYDFSAINTSECDMNGGSISIQVTGDNVASLFPMSYTLARDVDENQTFNSNDQYINGVDNSASTIDINNLAYGRYRITVASSMGCNLKSFDFYVFNCYTVLLPLRLASFKYQGVKEGLHQFQCQVTGVENLKRLVLEATNGEIYTAVSTINNPAALYSNGLITLAAPKGSYKNFRLRLIDQKDEVTYSNIINIHNPQPVSINRLWPNPVSRQINMEVEAQSENEAHYTIYNIHNGIVKSGSLRLRKGINAIQLPANNIPSGIYYLSIVPGNQQQPVSFRFVKQ